MRRNQNPAVALLSRPAPLGVALAETWLAERRTRRGNLGVRVELTLTVTARNGSERRELDALRFIERWCLKVHGATRLSSRDPRYKLTLLPSADQSLDMQVTQLLERMKARADCQECDLDAEIVDRATGRAWS